MNIMSSVEVQHHLTGGPSAVEPEQPRSASSTPKDPAESSKENQISAPKDPPERKTSTELKLKDPPPSSTTFSSSKESIRNETRDADDEEATPRAASPAAQYAWPSKLSPVNLKCEEEMPAFFDFSDLPNPPPLNLLPHVILTLSYVAINQLLGEDSTSASKSRALNRQRKFPPVIAGVAPTLEKLSARSGNKKRKAVDRNLSKQVGIKKKANLAKVLKNMKEAVRLRALGISTEPIEKDLPFSYDWGPDSSLQLGSKTGSSAWNRILVQQSIRHLQETGAGVAEVMSYRVPQVNAVETLVALQENLSRITSAPGSFPPPPLYELHNKKKTIRTSEDGALVYMSDRMARLYDSIKKKESDSSPYQAEVSVLRANDVVHLLSHFHEKSQHLDRRYEAFLEANRDESASPSKAAKSTKSAYAATAIADAEPMEMDESTTDAIHDTTANGDSNKKNGSIDSYNMEKHTNEATGEPNNVKKMDYAEKGKAKVSNKKAGPEPLAVDRQPKADKGGGDGEINEKSKSAGIQQPASLEPWRVNIRKFIAQQDPSAPRYLQPHDRP